MEEDCRHLLVLVLHKAEHLKGKPAHLTLAILNYSCLWVLVAANWYKRLKLG